MEPTTTIVALQNLVTKLVESVKDRKFAIELREVQGLISRLIAENFSLQESKLQLQFDNMELKQQIAALQERVSDAKKQANNAEEVRFHSGVKFKKGDQTGGVWMPFCQKCDLVLQVAPSPYSHLGILCPNGKCGFRSMFPSSDLKKVIAEICGPETARLSEAEA